MDKNYLDEIYSPKGNYPVSGLYQRKLSLVVFVHQFDFYLNKNDVEPFHDRELECP